MFTKYFSFFNSFGCTFKKYCEYITSENIALNLIIFQKSKSSSFLHFYIFLMNIQSKWFIVKCQRTLHLCSVSLFCFINTIEYLYITSTKIFVYFILLTFKTCCCSIKRFTVSCGLQIMWKLLSLLIFLHFKVSQNI